MMTNEQLCALALAAIDDADARVVLLDALLVTGWWDARLAIRWWPSFHSGESKWQTRERWLRTMSPDPDRISTRGRAIAAVLLFGDWPTSWPLAIDRCACEAPCERTGRGCRWTLEEGENDVYCRDCFRFREYALAEHPHC